MNKQQYLEKRSDLLSQKPKVEFGSKLTDAQKEKSSEINQKLKEILDAYIETSKPCSLNDTVQMVLNCGRTVKGIVIDMGILHDGNIHPTAYKVGNKTMYITVPIKELKILE